MLVLKRIHVTYYLRLDDGDDLEAVQRVLRVHADACPVFRSIHPQIHVTTELQLT